MPKIKNPALTVEIHYEKNPTYRTIFADGLIGGVAPTGNVNLNFYATRNVIPKSTSNKVNIDSKIESKGEPSDDSKNGIIREIECGVYMTRETAIDIYKFLETVLEIEKEAAGRAKKV